MSQSRGGKCWNGCGNAALNGRFCSHDCAKAYFAGKNKKWWTQCPHCHNKVRGKHCADDKAHLCIFMSPDQRWWNGAEYVDRAKT